MHALHNFIVGRRAFFRSFLAPLSPAWEAFGVGAQGPGQRLEGICRRRVDLVSGRFAVLANSREFTLAPWRPELERHRERAVSGRMVGDDFAIDHGRERKGSSLPSM